PSDGRVVRCARGDGLHTVAAALAGPLSVGARHPPLAPGDLGRYNQPAAAPIERSVVPRCAWSTVGGILRRTVADQGVVLGRPSRHQALASPTDGRAVAGHPWNVALMWHPRSSVHPLVNRSAIAQSLNCRSRVRIKPFPWVPLVRARLLLLTHAAPVWALVWHVVAGSA